LNIRRPNSANSLGVPWDNGKDWKTRCCHRSRKGRRLLTIVHAVLEITDKPLGKDRAIFSGSLEQIEQVRGCAKIGADEVFFDPAFAPGGQSLDRWLSL
jgi:hypothetical protein